MDLAPGDRLADRFVVRRKLGSGASGAVYEALDMQRQIPLALKVLKEIDPGSLYRFKSEFRTLANLTHPNLLQLYDLLSHDETWLLTMELVEGQDFLQYLRPAGAEDAASDELADAPTLVTGPNAAGGVSTLRERMTRASRRACFDGARLRGAFLQLCEGLSALHRAERLHRDLKPANVLVTSAESRVVICDFGLALEGAQPAHDRSPEHESPPSDSVFPPQHREVAGTLAYMSPEQAQGEILTPAADWYCVGVMLYQALTGQLPFPASLPLRAVISAKLHTPPLHPRRLVPGVPRELADLALALLHPEPRLRAGLQEVVDTFEDQRSQSRRDRCARLRRTFVGRAEPIEALTRAFNDSQNGLPTLALVSGPSGMGKSSLVKHVLASIERDSDALVLRTRCYEHEELPYKAVDPLIDALSTHLMRLDPLVVAPLLPASLPYLSALFPSLMRVPAIAQMGAAPEVADPRDRRRLAFGAFRELCRNLARRRAIVLFIDDLQWGDLDSAQLFQDLLAPPNAPAVLVVCAHRSEDAQDSPLLSLLRRTHALDPGALRLVDVPVGALAEAAAQKLAYELLDGRPGAEQAAARIAREAEGSPFFVRELVEYALEHGLEAAGRIELEGLVRGKLAQLSPASRKLMSMIAVAGRPIAAATVNEAARLGPSTFKLLRELELRRLLSSSRAGADETLECRHDRIREAICQVLPEMRCRELHRELAEVLERAARPDWDALLEHWRGAGDRAKAGAYALRGAQAAENALAFKRAADLYREALALLQLEDERQREICERLGHALILAGHGAEAAREFLALLPGATESQVLTYRMLATTQLLRAGELSAGFTELARADDVFGVRLPRSQTKALAMLFARKLKIRMLEPNMVVRERDHELARGERLDRLWEVAAAVSIADLVRGGVYAAELMLRAIELGDPSQIAGACGLEAVAAAAGGDPARAQKMLDVAEAAGERSGRSDVRGRVRGMHAICRYFEGRWLESIRLARESLALHVQSATLNWDQAMMISWEMSSVAMAGQLSLLSARVPEALRDAEARGDVYAATSFRTYRLSWAWLARDLPDVAEQHVYDAERDWDPEGYQFQHWHMTHAHAEVDLYRETPARSLARLQREWRRAKIMRRVDSVRADMLSTRGRLLLATARRARGSNAHALRSAAVHGRRLIAHGMPWTVGLGTLLLAGAATFERSLEAVPLLALAERQFEAADMALHREVCRYRRGQLQGDRAGQALAEDALGRIARLGAARPERIAAMLAPMRC